jgi:hypothetical protein
MSDRQPGLWPQSNISSGIVELFPAVWGYAEALCDPDANERKEALVRLEEMGAPRLSPLVSYLIATRLSDTDIEIRARAVRIVGDLLTFDDLGNAPPETVRQYLNAHLSRMRTRDVYNLLEIAADDPEVIPQIGRVLDACPYAGRHLGDIALDRTIPVQLRKQAVLFVGTVGYLEAIQPLERLAVRLEARLKGQQSMAFAPPAQSDEQELLPMVQSVLQLLQTP